MGAALVEETPRTAVRSLTTSHQKPVWQQWQGKREGGRKGTEISSLWVSMPSPFLSSWFFLS